MNSGSLPQNKAPFFSNPFLKFLFARKCVPMIQSLSSKSENTIVKRNLCWLWNHPWSLSKTTGGGESTTEKILSSHTPHPGLMPLVPWVSTPFELGQPAHKARQRRHGGLLVRLWGRDGGRREKSCRRREKEEKKERKKEKEKGEKRWVDHVSHSEWRLFQLFKILNLIPIFLKFHNDPI